MNRDKFRDATLGQNRPRRLEFRSVGKFFGDLDGWIWLCLGPLNEQFARS